MSSNLNKALYIGVSLVVIASILPTALLQIASTDTTGWNSAVATIFKTLIPILAVLGLVMGFLYFGGYRRGSMKIGNIVQIAVVLLVLAVVFPIGINSIATMQTATTIGTNTYTIDSSTKTLLQTLLPIVAVISVAFGFLMTSKFRR